MMEQKKALTLPFTVDKDHMMENPLKIPVNCLSSECGKLEGQVSWTTFAGCKYKSRNSRHKNGSTRFDHSHATFITLEMTRKKPLLILTDVLKTEHGKNYIERVKMRGGVHTRGQLTSTQKESGDDREEPRTCRNNRSCQKELNNNDKSKCLTPKSNQNTTPISPQRARIKRRSQQSEESNKEENKDIKEVVTGQDSKEEESAKVRDGVNAKSTEDATSCDEFASESIKDQSTTPVKEAPTSSRKRKNSGSRCNGTSSPKCLRENVLRLSGEDTKAGEQVPTPANQEEHEKHVDLENVDHCIVQFTVGGDDGTEDWVPVTPCNLEAEDIIKNNEQSLSSRHESTSQTSPTEPIVLSSDDEEGRDNPQCQSKVVHAASDSVIQGKSSQKAVSEEEEDPAIQNMQMLQLVVDESPLSAPASPIPEVDFSCLSVAFFTLHCGRYQVRSNGGLTVAKHEIIIPLKDKKEQQQEEVFSFERTELRRYSVWDQQDLELSGFQFEGDEKHSSGILLFYVSETAAAAVQRDLCQLCVEDEGSINTEKASPFILLTLKDPLEGMEGALLRSVLDIDCINNMTRMRAISDHSEDIFGNFVDLKAPLLTLDESIDLIARTGLDSHLLCMLGIQSTDTEQSRDQDSPSNDEDELPTAHIWVDVDLQKELEPEPEDTDALIEPSEDTEAQTEPKEDQKEEELENSDSKKKEAQPVYTVCHQRTKGSYSVSLSKPDSNWIKYKHQGVARRLIQFPPPPLKGGITVTMEDLQCLDSGQYLNDVIIDFYLKYLIQNASAAIAERCHIFSSFFYKQLTRRDNASEGSNSEFCQRQRRHQRVKTWTRHVEIFEKDFLFVPVNQEAHWYLVVICFPWLEEPKHEDCTEETQSDEEAQECKSSKVDTETLLMLNSSDSVDSEKDTRDESTKDLPPCPVSCTEQTCERKTVCKRPCILIMDSLKLSLHERVFKLIREYLQSEWEARRGSSRDFGPDQMKSSHCKVPLQDNSSDCGLYLLQYVECFLKDPIVHFDLPLHLQKWFPRQLVRKKRDEIRDLILNLYRHQNLDNVENKKPPC
ncbi:sentrin-specific protease 7 [Nematolebias whitei]|uniref:sentrin-specific protease 7 n=1 Tax=Nematolebias whitei TaxID=451745 RepID=UPI001897F5BE|nr:sentrin-specific protease 7 [Nematolebias whitei]